MPRAFLAKKEIILSFPSLKSLKCGGDYLNLEGFGVYSGEIFVTGEVLKRFSPSVNSSFRPWVTLSFQKARQVFLDPHRKLGYPFLGGKAELNRGVLTNRRVQRECVIALATGEFYLAISYRHPYLYRHLHQRHRPLGGHCLG